MSNTIKFGKIDLNVKALANISEEEFYTIVRGNIDIDKKIAWEKFQKVADPHKRNPSSYQKGKSDVKTDS